MYQKHLTKDLPSIEGKLISCLAKDISLFQEFPESITIDNFTSEENRIFFKVYKTLYEKKYSTIDEVSINSEFPQGSKDRQLFESKARYFGKFLDMCYEEEYYGKFGEATDMTYEDGSPVHTGDIVELFCDNKSYGHRIVAHSKYNYGVMGVFSRKFTNGKADDWRIKLVCKYYNNNKDKVGDIIIVDKDQFIQLEGGKNLTIDQIAVNGEKYIKVNDDFINIKNIKKVFTIDEDCEIEYEDYEVFSTSSLFNEDRLTIIRKNGIEIVRLANPTPDKVRHEFEYYGIDVEVK